MKGKPFIVSYFFIVGETIVVTLPHNWFLLDHLTSLEATLLDNPTCMKNQESGQRFM